MSFLFGGICPKACIFILLLSCLSSRFGFAGSALKWFRSYLQDRFQSVKIGSSLSNLFKLKFCFPSTQHLLVKSSENIPESVTTSMRTTLSCSFTYPLMIVSSLLTILNHV